MSVAFAVTAQVIPAIELSSIDQPNDSTTLIALTLMQSPTRKVKLLLLEVIEEDARSLPLRIWECGPDRLPHRK